MLRAAHERAPSTSIALAGGCAMNSVANGKIRKSTPFRRVFVQPAAGDAGGAIGAAYSLWHRLGGARNFVMDHASWGPDFGRSEIAAALEAGLTSETYAVEEVSDDDQLCQRVAREVADGLIVGWFQGRMEWGARALGNRSIICDPRRAEMKDILNARIKRRESFRPFAPSILEDAVPDWFEEHGEVPFMAQVFSVRAEKRDAIPAVVHVDGSARLHTVSEAAAPLYHRLIRSFESVTGIPIVLNTSFNDNEPIVCTPKEAIACFTSTNMDLLAIGPFIAKRRTSH
jgi:carbamoyltransferase